MRTAVLITLGGLLVGACRIGTTESSMGPAPTASRVDARGYVLPPPPEFPDGPLKPEVRAVIDALLDGITESFDSQALATIVASDDARLGWLIADLLRFIQVGPPAGELKSAFERLTGTDLDSDPSSAESVWRSVTDHLIGWDLPAPPDYREMKAQLFLLVEPRWEPFFTDSDAAIDWRWLSWGGVLIDDRPLGDSGPCSRGCIPALDDPALTDAAGGDWYSDGLIVFGVEIGDESVAFPRNMMEVHELVNISVGGRRLGIPYCTLCGSAQGYFTDVSDDPLVLRTSGLLSRSNKVMYDLGSKSVFDTFTGEAVSGPLQDAGLVLEQTTVVSSTWGDWKEAHPDTRIVARDGGIGRVYPDDPLGGRDVAGPIFPVGPVDPRLPVQAQVVGVISPDGTAIAFPVDQARTALASGSDVRVGEVRLVGDGSGLRAEAGGAEVPAHQAFWFAWSQFHPDTLVWTPLTTG